MSLKEARVGKEWLNESKYEKYFVDDHSFYIRNSSDVDVIKEVFVLDGYKLKQKIKEPKVVFDIGGHIGTFSYLAKTLWNDVTIIFVEPNTESMNIAKKNLRSFDGIHFFDGAMKYNKSENFYIDAVGTPLSNGTKVGTGTGIMVDSDFKMENLIEWKQDEGYSSNVFAVESNIKLHTIEDLMKSVKINKIDLLKLDCEGGEIEFFKNFSLIDSVYDFLGEFHYNIADFYFTMRNKFPKHKLSLEADFSHQGLFWGERHPTY